MRAQNGTETMVSYNAATFHDRHERWHRKAQAEWERMDDEAGQRS